jgi:hypothetical protein
MRRKSFVVVAGAGPPCPRCATPMQVREHRRIKAKHLRQPFYYKRWHCCRNPRCPTTLVMDEKHKVFPQTVACEDAVPIAPNLVTLMHEMAKDGSDEIVQSAKLSSASELVDISDRWC